MWEDLATAVLLILVLEGTLYALFPEAMRRLLMGVAAQPPDALRNAGLFSLAIGAGMLWIIKS